MTIRAQSCARDAAQRSRRAVIIFSSLSFPSPDVQRAASIFVTDDNESVLTLVQLSLQHAGYSVACANGRAPVLSMLRTREFDLVITDILMPEIDGAEVIAATRVHQPGAAILAMSGGGPHVTADLCLKIAKKLGAVVPLLKPFHLNELLLAVEKALQQRPATALVE
jgi:DNA-binding NtrC family response regulator